MRLPNGSCSGCPRALRVLRTLVALTPEVLQLGRGPCRRMSPGGFGIERRFNNRASGHYFVFDRRAHMVYGHGRGVRKRVADRPYRRRAWPHHRPDGVCDSRRTARFVVADAPEGRPRIQVFDPAGFRESAASRCPIASRRARRLRRHGRLSGIASIQFTGSSILVSQPENGALVTEYSGIGTRGAGRSGHCARPATRTTGICTSR